MSLENSIPAAPLKQIDSSSSLLEASRFFLEEQIEGAQVVDNTGKVVGILTRTNLLEAMVKELPVQTCIRDIMSFDPDMTDFMHKLKNILDRYEQDVASDGQPPADLDKNNQLLWTIAQLFHRRKTFWHTLLNSVYNPVIGVNKQGRINVYNEAASKGSGIQAADAYGRYINEVYKTSRLTDVLETGQIEITQKIEEVGKTFVANRSPIYIDGKLVGAISVLQETSELETILEELASTKALNRQLDAIFESSYDGLYITDGEANTLRLNQGFERIMGVTAEECIGRNMRDLVNEGVYSRSGTLAALEKGDTVTLDLVAKTGKRALVTSTPIYDDEGKPILVVTNVRDITELIDLENRLEHIEGLREKELAAIFESSYDGLYITDGEANTLRLNQGFERIMGVTDKECIGRNMKDLVNEGVFSRSGTLVALEREEPVTLDLVAKTGKKALVTSTPIYDDDGKPILVVTNVRDITELNELQGKLEHLEGLSRFYQEELNSLKLQNSRNCVFQSKIMQDLLTLVVHIASVDSTVLIQGESGVGKEVIADILYANSIRKDGPFIKINCGAIPPNLLESELFGYEPGAFTGASKKGKAGMFELASGGMLFLDEIGDLPLDLQVKLLRVIQDMTVTRVGGTQSIKIDVRIIAGTNRPLQDMIAKHLFRKDLYYRLNVVPISVPPLRERREDIPVLCKHFLELFNNKHNMKKSISVM
jgi:PAS domain S-box-containing protein